MTPVFMVTQVWFWLQQEQLASYVYLLFNTKMLLRFKAFWLVGFVVVFPERVIIIVRFPSANLIGDYWIHTKTEEQSPLVSYLMLPILAEFKSKVFLTGLHSSH